MNAIEKFAREHVAEYNPDLEAKFKDAVQSVIGNKGKVVDAWSYNNSVPGDDYHTSSGYIDWWSEIRGMDGMAPNTYIVVCLSTDLEFMSQWLTCFYRDEYGNDLTTDYSGDVGNFDVLPLIDKCLKQAGKSESRKFSCSMQKKKESLVKKSESKKNEDHPDEYYKWADEKVAEEYADDYGLFSTVVDDMMSLADDMANDIISEHGLEDSEQLHEDIKELVYESMCRTMVSQFGGVTKDR